MVSPVVTGTSTPGVYLGGRYGQPQSQSQSPTIGASAGMSTAPRQRPGGTVYGGQTGLPTTTNSEAPLEMSGSLTGLILSRGRSPAQQAARRKKERRSRVRRVVLIALGTLVFFGLLGVVVMILAGDFIRTLIHALTG